MRRVPPGRVRCLYMPLVRLESSSLHPRAPPAPFQSKRRRRRLKTILRSILMPPERAALMDATPPSEYPPLLHLFPPYDASSAVADIKGLGIGESSYYVFFRAEQGQLKPIDRRAVKAHKAYCKAGSKYHHYPDDEIGPFKSVLLSFGPVAGKYEGSALGLGIGCFGGLSAGFNGVCTIIARIRAVSYVDRFDDKSPKKALGMIRSRTRRVWGHAAVFAWSDLALDRSRKPTGRQLPAACATRAGGDSDPNFENYDRNACDKKGAATHYYFTWRGRRRTIISPGQVPFQITLGLLRRARWGHSGGAPGRGELRGQPWDERRLERGGAQNPEVSTQCLKGHRFSAGAVHCTAPAGEHHNKEGL